MQHDQRKSARKVYRTKALLAMDGMDPFTGKTADVGANGVSISLPDPLMVGQVGQLSFELLVEGSFVTINTRAKALYCIFSNGDYKVGFQFLSLDLSGVTALTRFLR